MSPAKQDAMNAYYARDLEALLLLIDRLEVAAEQPRPDPPAARVPGVEWRDQEPD